ncbi:MAG: AfsA-related hotdog domain-containing protein [Desulfosudaceae bacterium]
MRGMDKSFVHKQNQENVFIQDLFRQSEHTFTAVSTVPADHPVYDVSTSTYLVEVGRQANMAICHRFYDVPFDTRFIVVSIQWEIPDNRPLVNPGAGPWEVKITFAGRKVFLGRTWFRTESLFFRDGQVLMKGKARFYLADENEEPGRDTVCEASLERLDYYHHADFLQVHNPDNVLITPPEHVSSNGQFCSHMSVDPHHFYFFEHPCTHVPGMMLLEAGKQLALCAAKQQYEHLAPSHGDLVAGKVKFRRFALLNRKIRLKAGMEPVEMAPGRGLVRASIGFHQEEEQLGKIECLASFV